MTAPRFQIASDLHLETPVQTPAYAHFSSPTNFRIIADHLLLLGDIGLIAQEHLLLPFLRALLARSPSLKIFYVLGNHEPYHMTLESALSKMHGFETALTQEFGPRFHVMSRRRIDLNETLTLLGCTLWTHVPADHAREVAGALKDLDSENGIRDRSLSEHNADHARDVAWLNAQVAQIEAEEPHREIVVLTHHSPTIDARANSSRFPPERPMNAGFRTDLSGEKCWTCANVKVWAFGHTHFSCQFVDLVRESMLGTESRKLVVSNQKGYALAGNKGNWIIDPVVIGMDGGVCKVTLGEKSSEGTGEQRVNENP